jgi:hypothetical protein
MLGRAGGRECAWQAEHGDALASSQLVEFERVRSDGTAVAFDFDEFLQFPGWELVSNFEHRASPDENQKIRTAGRQYPSVPAVVPTLAPRASAL